MPTNLPPPRCLEGVLATPTTAPDILLDTLTEWPNRFFALRCRHCDANRFSVAGEIVPHGLIDQDVVIGPVTATCEACQRAVVLFDPTLHGYDVEIDHFPPTHRASTSPRRYACSTCSESAFTLVARFEYPESSLAAAAADNGQELFSFFTLVGHCCGCQALTTLASVEC